MNLDLLPQTLELLNHVKYKDVNGLGLEEKDFGPDISKQVWSQFIEGFIFAKYSYMLGDEERYNHIKALNKKYYDR